jgi:hypothetical protein
MWGRGDARVLLQVLQHEICQDVGHLVEEVGREDCPSGPSAALWGSGIEIIQDAISSKRASMNTLEERR